MPNRIVRDSVLDSERYHSVDKTARLAFHEMILCADDYGLLPVSRVFLRRHLTAFDGLTDQAATTVLSTMSDADLIRVYTSDKGGEFAYIPRFGNWPRAKKPKWPTPPDELGGNEIKNLQQKRIADAKQMNSVCTESAPETETETETETEILVLGRAVGSHRAGAKPAVLTLLGDEENLKAIQPRAMVSIGGSFELPSDWGRDAEALGWKPSAILKESEKFRQYWVSGKGSGTRRTVKGWRQSWSNWLAKAEKYA